jgi:hypothetical protein
MDAIVATEELKRCEVCGGERLFATCIGCEMELCESCARFELIGSGCGCVWPVYYCPGCVQNPSINPNAMLREPGL